MLVYPILIVLTILLGGCISPNKTEKRKRLYLILIFSIIAILFSLRHSDIGKDTKLFFAAYRQIAALNWSSFNNTRFEYGFFIMCKLLSCFSPNAQLLVMFTGCLICYAFAKYIYYNSSDVVFSTYLFITFDFIGSTMNLMRQSVALSIVLLGFNYLKEKKHLHFSFIVILASFFHISALCCFVLIIFARFNVKRVILISTAVFFVSIPLLKTLLQYILDKIGRYQRYLTSDWDALEDVRGFVIIYLLIIIAILICGHFVIDRNNPRLAKINFDLLETIVITSMSIRLIALNFYIFGRIEPLFKFSMLAWIPLIPSWIKNTKLRAVILCGLFGCFLIFFIFRIVYNRSYEIYPYKFYWQ